MATKRLARQLGIIRRLSKTSSSDGGHGGHKKKQLFDYLIIIDFESTCWKDARSSYSQEIIEFPAVLLNTANGVIESEFHIYVQPQEHPILSEFCTELTGIKQDQVDEGIPLHICLSQFSKWIQKIQKDKKIVFSLDCSVDAVSEGKLCAFVTWSDWDLGVCLHYECKRKQLRKPDILNSWIDLRATYKLFYCRKPKGLNGALQDVGILFSGREHSGLDDSRNTARLAWKMICDGCVLKITKSLNKAPSPQNSIARFLQIKPTNNSPLGSSAKESCLDGIKNGAVTREVEHNKENLLQQEFSPAFSRGNCHILPRNAKNERYFSVQGSLTPYAGSPLGCFRTSSCNSLNFQSGLKSGPLLSGPSVQNSGLVLVNTTLSSVNVSSLDISTSSECLVKLADWEEVALLPATQDDQSSGCLEGGNPFEGGSLLAGDESVDPSELSRVSFRPQMDRSALNTIHSKSVVYKSPNTTIYSTGPSKFSNAAVFKLPGTKASGTEPNGKLLSSSLEAQKRKASSPKSVPPPKKPPFVLHKDESPAPSRSSGLHPVPSGILKPSSNIKQLFKAAEVGRVTPPLCKCGRRARRLNVSNGGPNHGKAFYSCPSGKQEGAQRGCGYFKWEHALQKEKLAPSFPASNALGMPQSCCRSSGSSQRKCLGLRPSMRT